MRVEEKAARVQPRIIIHGGAGNITRENLSHDSYQAYRQALLRVLQEANDLLLQDNATALDIATHAVSLLENNALFNSGHGAVYTRAGTHELEASVMVSKGYRKRGVGVMKVTRAKNPILLAKEMLVQGEKEDGGGAQGHCQLEGDTCDRLARDWHLETVKPSYYWTKKRWDEHRRGLGLSHGGDTYREHRRHADASQEDDGADRLAGGKESDETERICASDPSWDGKEYLPQGTVGAVVLDSTGTVCVATSTGGLTNKLPGRIGDTPTLGAGFWAGSWQTTHITPPKPQYIVPSLASLLYDCLPGLAGYTSLPSQPTSAITSEITHATRAVGMSGTGNGDSFLRLNAVRTAAAISEYTRNSPHSTGTYPLQDAVSAVAGPNGSLQMSAEDRWRKTGEGEGGIIGIDFSDAKGGEVVADFNCGGMFRAWIDRSGKARMAVFREEV